MDAPYVEQLGRVALAVDLVRSAARANPARARLLQSKPEDRAQIEAAEKVLEELSGLQLVRFLVDHGRITGRPFRV
jgi:hypothetical protein